MTLKTRSIVGNYNVMRYKKHIINYTANSYDYYKLAPPFIFVNKKNHV